MELAVYFHRDEVAAPETISGTAATNAIVGTNTTFTTDCYVGQKLYVPDVGTLEIATITDDTHATVEALSSDFTDAKPFYSWTRYYVELSEIAKQVESDNPGEAGAVVLDSVTTTFRNHATDAAPVNSAFALSELNGDRRYLFAIFAVKPGETPKQVFSGMADFASVERSPFYVTPGATEIVPTVTFEIVDLFAALNLVQSQRYKTLGRLVDSSAYTGDYRYPDNPSDARIPLFIKHSSSRFVTMRIVDYDGGSYTPQTLAASNTPQVGDVLPWVFADDHDAADVEYIEDDAGDDFAMSPSGYAFLVVQKHRSSGGDYVCFDAISNSGSFYDDHTNALHISPPIGPDYLADTDDLVGSDTVVAYQKLGYYDELFGGVDIFVRENVSTTFPVPAVDTPDNWTGDYTYDGRAYGIASETATSERIVAIDGVAALKAIVAQVWPDLEFELRLKRWDSGTSSYVAMTEYRLPTDYVFRLLDSYPFGKEPLEAVQFIASAIRAYLYIDGTGKAIFVNEAHLLDATPTALSLADALSLRRRDFWDKLCDVAKVYVRSWMPDPDDPEPYAYLDGAGAAWRSDAANTKPRNPIEKELIVDEPSLEAYGYEIDGGNLVDTANPLLPAEQVLNAYAEEKAAEYLAFYGMAHEAIEATFGLTWAMLDWELTGVFSYSTSDYFATRLTLDLMRDTLDVELIGLSGRTYHSESVRVGKKEDGYLTPTSGNAQVLIGSSAAGGSTSANLGWDGRATYLDALRGRGSLGLGALALKDGVNDDDWNAVAGKELSAANGGTGASNAGTLTVNGDVTFAASAAREIDLGGDLTTGAALTFALGGATTLSFRTTGALELVDALREVATSSPLTGGGDLSANRTLGLSYNATNLRQTSGALNTIQNIATSSSPQFAGVGLGVSPVAGYGLTVASDKDGGSSSYASGWSGHGWKLDSAALGGGSYEHTLEIDNLNVRGTLAVYELLIRQIRATNGNVLVTSAGKIEEITQTYDPGSYEFEMLIESANDSVKVTPFASGDVLLCQRVDVSGSTIVKRYALKVTGVSVGGVGNKISATPATGFTWSHPTTTDLVTAGDDLVRIGSETDANRRGTIGLYADETNAPFLRVQDGVASWSDWLSASKLKVQLGRLDGLTDADFGALSGYGLYATDNVYIKGVINALDGGTIANWDIKTNVLESGTAANGNDRLLLSTENVDGAFWGAAGGRSFGLSAIQWHSGHASMVQIGRLFDDYDTVGDYVGVQLLRDTNDIPFRLAMYENTYDCRIAAFAFDADEMKYNDGTDDLLRIGVFTNPTETYSTTTLASFPSAFTEQTGETHFTGTLTGDDFEITNDGWDGQTQPKWRCPIPTTMAGKTVTLDYDFSWGLADWPNSFVYVRVVAVESGTSAELYMFENAYQLTTSQPGASESESFTLPNDISSAYLEVHLYGSGVDTRYGIEPEEVIALNDLSLIYYNKGKTEINDNGLKVYFSPINRIVLTQDEASFNVPLVEANMLKLGAWRIYPEPPSFGASAKLYFRYGSSVKGYLSSSGTGQIN